MIEAMPSAPPAASRRAGATHRVASAIIAAALMSAAVLVRLPPLLNARDVNSDAATVGLQALHMLRGEWSWFLWGAGYQSSLDSVLAAAAFALFGVSPLVLMLVPLLGFVVVVGLAFAILERHLRLLPAAACVLVLVVGSAAINLVTVAPPRQWCVVLLFASVFVLDGAAGSRRSSGRFAFGCFCAVLAVFVDLYALTFVPGIALFALLCVLGAEPDRPRRLEHARACLTGAAVGTAAVVAIRLIAHAPTGGVLGMGLYHLRQRLVLLWSTCLPFALGYNLYRDSVDPFARGLWAAPLPWYVLQVVAGWSLLAGIGAGGLMFATRSVPPAARRLGVLGAAVAASTVAGFVASTAPVDMWTARYLGPIFWFAPFALAPVASRLGGRRFAAAMAPYLIVAAIATWAGYGFYAEGGWPRRYAAAHFEREEQQLCDFLRSRGIRYAASDYWFAYRFSLVFREDPVIAPIELSQNRYDPYITAFRSEPLKAWVFHPAWSRTPMTDCLEVLRGQRIPFSRHQVGEFTVIVFPDRSSVPDSIGDSTAPHRPVPALLY